MSERNVQGRNGLHCLNHILLSRISIVIVIINGRLIQNHRFRDKRKLNMLIVQQTIGW